MTKEEIAGVLEKIATLLELKDENPFKVRAYTNAARAIEHWKHQADPLPFALAEYNAGASRAQRWSGGNDIADMPVGKFLQNIDFPGTRKYIESIIDRYKFYQRRGRM